MYSIINLFKDKNFINRVNGVCKCFINAILNFAFSFLKTYETKW